MKTDDGSVCRTTQRTKNERLICSGRSARRTAYRCRFVYGRTYCEEEIDDDPDVCLSCREPAWKCEGEYRCYLRHKAMREKPKKKEVSEMLLESWKPSGIYDIWGESLHEKKRKISTHGKTQSRNKLEIPSDDPAVCLNCRKVRCSGERSCYLERKREAERKGTE